jgi:hypothetical protein
MGRVLFGGPGSIAKLPIPHGWIAGAEIAEFHHKRCLTLTTVNGKFSDWRLGYGYVIYLRCGIFSLAVYCAQGHRECFCW